ncbi:MAG: superoxide dismutase, partial [Planctomycetota bacterium]
MSNTDSTSTFLSRRSAMAAGAFGVPLATLASMASARDDHNHGDAAGPVSTKLGKVLGATHNGTTHTLPPLPYAYDAVSPNIDELTMELHHGKHHNGYVNGLNKTIETLAKVSRGEAEGSMYELQRNLSFNYAGHVLHSIFWATMGPDDNGNMGGAPQGTLAEAMNASFGSFDNFKTQFAAAGKSVKGSGWVMLLLDPIAGSLHISTANEHDVYFPAGAIPLLPCDVWEH